jgi:hypothetical protein
MLPSLLLFDERLAFAIQGFLLGHKLAALLGPRLDLFLHQPGFEALGRRNLSSSSLGAIWHFSSQLQGVMLIRYDSVDLNTVKFTERYNNIEEYLLSRSLASFAFSFFMACCVCSHLVFSLASWSCLAVT